MSSLSSTVRARRGSPVLWWAGLGVMWMLFQAYVLGRWVSGPHFVPVDPGPDPISEQKLMLFAFLQVAVPLAALLMYGLILIRPWLREKRITTDGRIIIAAGMVFFWDMSMNYSSTALFYNSHFVNFGSWTLGSWPTWMSPNGHRLPEPILFIAPAYICLVFSQVLFICWLLRRVRQRFPALGLPSMLALIVVGLTIIDSIIEIIFLRTGMYAYPGGIHALTLWAGETYQFPLTEGFLFGGLGLGAIAALHLFRDDQGRTFTERGVEQLRYSERGKSWLRLLSIYGYVHTAFFLLYFIPCQWVSLNTDPFPEGYPSYMSNGMCVYGVDKNQCPGPGVMMPRPPFD